MDKIRQVIKVILFFMIIFFILTIGGVYIFRFVPIPCTPIIAWQWGTHFFSASSHQLYKKWVPLEEISKSVPKAVIKAEDANFYTHNGFDFEAIEKAIKYNATHKKKKGASTISQQTAKNVFLWPARSWLRKGLEAYFTVLIETLWPKKRIMEVYLNVIELGPMVYGVEAASLKYFHKHALYLTPYEAALIAAVLPNPIKFKINKPSAYVFKRQQRILGISNVDQKKESYDLKFDSEEDVTVTDADAEAEAEAEAVAEDRND